MIDYSVFAELDRIQEWYIPRGKQEREIMKLLDMEPQPMIELREKVLATDFNGVIRRLEKKDIVGVFEYKGILYLCRLDKIIQNTPNKKGEKTK